ncbi:MAG TPA: NADPH-dependent FMN reductase, partial [Steroidobacteraceae bacterium]|nr:NADPH-dependent FMN reductase [Steroidobacteraceae bacterium]
MQRLLAISGSLRAASSNTSILRAAQLLAPAGMVIEHYVDLGSLPHFNPDLESAPPAAVVELRERVGQAAGLLISCPEYARGIPGSFKNALDWLVGSLTFPGKAVALINTSPRASAAQAALRLVLTTMSARIIEEASITVDLLSRRLDARAIAADPELARTLGDSLRVF